MYQLLGRLSEDILGTRGRISGLDSELQNLKLFENFLADTALSRERIKSGFVSRGNLVRFIEDLEQVGKDGGIAVEVDSASLAATPEERGPSFRLSAKGSFSSLFQYLLTLENLPYEIVFEEIHLNSATGEKDKIIWSAAILIRLISYEF